MRIYDWLGFSSSALVDINEAYKIAYGGSAREGGIAMQNEERQSPPPLNLKTNFNNNELRKMNLSIGFAPMETSTSSSFAVGIATPAGSSFTGLGLQDLEVGESAKGRDYHAWSMKEDKGPHMRGPMTPNGYEDITPMTKGEWSFLKDGWNPRTAAVQTCR